MALKKERHPQGVNYYQFILMKMIFKRRMHEITDNHELNIIWIEFFNGLITHKRQTIWLRKSSFVYLIALLTTET